METNFGHIHSRIFVWLLAVVEQLLSESAPVALGCLPLAPGRAGRPPVFFSFFYSSMIMGSMCAISDFLLLSEKTVEWCEGTLKQN